MSQSGAQATNFCPKPTASDVAGLVRHLLNLLADPGRDSDAIAKVMSELRGSREKESQKFERADFLFYRMAAVDTLEAIYKSAGRPESASPDTLGQFLKNFLWIDSPSDADFELLMRGKDQLKVATDSLDVAAADKAESRNATFDKYSYIEIANENIGAILARYPENRLNEISVKRSNLHRLIKKNEVGQMLGQLDADTRLDSAEFILRDVLGFPSDAVKAAVSALTASGFRTDDKQI